MQYALVDGKRKEPTKGLKGTCESCHSEVIAKCGDIKLHHWAHKSIADCDTWWEPETEWHREWKNQFPEAFREVVRRDERTNEVHRADIHTASGVTIEFQNSPISINERKSRDDFYEKLIWIVNAKEFEITPTRNIPDPTSPLLDDYIFEVDKNGYGHQLLFSRKYDPVKNPMGRSRTFGINDNQMREVAEHLDCSGKYVMFTWKYARQVWLRTNAHIFLDFGYPDNIYWLRTRPQDTYPLKYLQVVKKRNFINKYWQ